MPRRHAHQRLLNGVYRLLPSDDKARQLSFDDGADCPINHLANKGCVAPPKCHPKPRTTSVLIAPFDVRCAKRPKFAMQIRLANE